MILAIESSCDETAAAVVKNGREVLSNVISSQIALHTLYGGVVPEIASRKHIEKINQVIETALLEMGGTTPHYLMIVDRVNNLDTLEVHVEVEERFFSDEIRALETLTAKIEHAIQQAIGLAVKVRLVEPKGLERSMGKSVHVIDKRKLDD